MQMVIVLSEPVSRVCQLMYTSTSLLGVLFRIKPRHKYMEEAYHCRPFSHYLTAIKTFRRARQQ